MAKQPLMTLLTDFGRQDPYVAAMKGVVLGICPGATLVDLSHDVPAHDVLAAAFVLAHAAPCYPPGTLHVVVVDPGVGTSRRILAAQFAEQKFLFPDNGVISLIAETMPLEAVHAVTNTRYLPAPSVSMTFHGRDIFAPIAGHILNGLGIRVLGPQPQTYKLLDIPAAGVEAGVVTGQIIYVDRFGNLVSNIPGQFLHEAAPDFDKLHVTCAGRDVGPLKGTYDFVPRGEPLALLNSMGLLEVAVNQGRASDVLNAGVGAEIRLAVR